MYIVGLVDVRISATAQVLHHRQVAVPTSHHKRVVAILSQPNTHSTMRQGMCCSRDLQISKLVTVCSTTSHRPASRDLHRMTRHRTTHVPRWSCGCPHLRDRTGTPPQASDHSSMPTSTRCCHSVTSQTNMHISMRQVMFCPARSGLLRIRRNIASTRIP